MNVSGKMRKLNESELDEVYGGLDFGTGGRGLFSPNNILKAARFSGGVGFVYSSFKLGWDIGSYGYSTYSRYKYSTR